MITVKRGEKRIVLSDYWTSRINTWLTESLRDRALGAFYMDDGAGGQCLVTDDSLMVSLSPFEYRELLFDRLGRTPTATEPVIMTPNNKSVCPSKAVDFFQKVAKTEGVPAMPLPWLHALPWESFQCRVVITKPGSAVRKALLFQERYLQIFNPLKCDFYLLIDQRGRPVVSAPPNILLAVRACDGGQLIAVMANVKIAHDPTCEQVLRYLAKTK